MAQDFERTLKQDITLVGSPTVLRAAANSDDAIISIRCANTTTSTTTNNSTTNGSDVPVNSANAPSFSAMSQDVCSTGISGSVSTLGFGVSGGKHVRDLNCERIKLSKVLFDYGMKVAAVSILCQDERVFEAMQMAGTPCPFEGKIGKEAKALWSKYDHERPDYDIYVKRMKAREKIQKQIEKKEALEQKRLAKEQAKMTKEFDEFDKQVEKKIKEKKKNIEWETPK